MMSNEPQPRRDLSRADVIRLVESGTPMQLGRYLGSSPTLPAAERDVLNRLQRGDLNTTTAAKALMALPPRA